MQSNYIYSAYFWCVCSDVYYSGSGDICNNIPCTLVISFPDHILCSSKLNCFSCMHFLKAKNSVLFCILAWFHKCWLFQVLSLDSINVGLLQGFIAWFYKCWLFAGNLDAFSDDPKIRTRSTRQRQSVSDSNLTWNLNYMRSLTTFFLFRKSVNMPILNEVN